MERPQKKMSKVLLITSGFMPMPPVKGGAVETLTENYLKYNESAKSCDFVVYSYGFASTKSFEKTNTEYRFIKENKLLEIVFKIAKKITFNYYPEYFLYRIKKDIHKRKESYDCALIENRPKYAPYTKRKICKEVVLHAHNEWFGKHPRNIYRACDKIIAVSEYMKQHNLTNETINKIKVVFNAVDEKSFEITLRKEEIQKLKQHYGINEKDTVILFTGKIKTEKGALELIEAFKKVNEKNSKSVLLMAGSISGNKKFIEKVNGEVARHRKIIMTGYIDYSELPKIYKIADLQIIPSQIEDQCPLTAFEGICSSIPQIVSDSGGIPEIVNNAGAIIVQRGKNFVNELYKQMLMLIENNEEMKKMSRKQEMKAKEYTNRAFCRKMIKEIMETCNETK